MNNDSGRSEGKRKTTGGRSSVRRVLYMAALVATRYNPRIREFYIRLLTQGKPKKVGPGGGNEKATDDPQYVDQERRTLD